MHPRSSNDRAMRRHAGLVRRGQRKALGRKFVPGHHGAGTESLRRRIEERTCIVGHSGYRAGSGTQKMWTREEGGCGSLVLKMLWPRNTAIGFVAEPGRKADYSWASERWVADENVVEGVYEGGMTKRVDLRVCCEGSPKAFPAGSVVLLGKPVCIRKRWLC